MRGLLVGSRHGAIIMTMGLGGLTCMASLSRVWPARPHLQSADQGLSTPQLLVLVRPLQHARSGLVVIVAIPCVAVSVLREEA